MQTQTTANKKTIFIYLVFMAWAFFSMVFLFLDLSVISFLRISLLTTPIIVLNIFAIALYICMPPKKTLFGICSCVLWGLFCIWLFVSPFIQNCDGVFGAFIWFAKSFPYEVLIMIAVSIVVYLIFVPFKIISVSIKQASIVQSLRDYAKGLVLPCLAALAGAVFHAVNNVDFLTPLTAAIFVALFVGVALLAYSLSSFALRKVLPYRYISLMTALSVLAWMFLPTTVALLRLYYHPLWLHTAFIVGIPLLLFYLFQNKPNLVLLYVLISLPLSGYSYIQHKPFDVKSVNKAVETDAYKLPSLPAAAIPDQAPNVYLIIYDATPNLHILDRLHIRGREDLQQTLADLKFKVYENTYSVAQISLKSMSATYNMSQVLEDANIIWRANGGLAAGFEIFRKNGYRVESVQNSFMTGTYQHFDKNLPPRTISLVEKGDFLFFLIKAMLAGEFQFEDIIKADGDLTPFKKEVFAPQQVKRLVVVHNYNPGHAQLSGECQPDEQALYEARFDMARDILREDIALIEQNDPTAIIIAMGDHGPYLTGDCTSLANSDPKKVSELEVMDRFSTLVAIRWPDPARAAKYDQNLTINQDILPTVFAYLYDSPEPLKWKIEPKAYLNGRLVIDNGKFCPVE